MVDVPSGRVTARVTRGGRTRRVTFRNVASYVLARDGRRCRPRGARCASTSATAGRSTPRSAAATSGSRSRRSTTRADRARPRGQAGPQRHHAGPAPRRPALGRRLRHDLVRRTRPTRRRPAPAQRHGLRRRRGRPLALRLGHLGAARAARRRRRLRTATVLRHDSIIGTVFAARVAGTTTADRPPCDHPRGRGHGVPHGRTRLCPRPARSPWYRVRVALRSPQWTFRRAGSSACGRGYGARRPGALMRESQA